MTVLTGIAIAMAGTAAAAWVVVSFSTPGRRRSIVEWTATVAIYAALCAFFLDLARSAWLEGRNAALVAFGLLTGLFAAGFLLSVAKLTNQMRGGGSRGVSTTN